MLMLFGLRRRSAQAVSELRHVKDAAHSRRRLRTTRRAAVNRYMISSRGFTSTIGIRTVRGGLLTIVSQCVRTALNLVTMIVLARFIAPVDFGLFAMGTAALALINAISDIGLSVATVQRKTLSQNLVSALFYLNVVAGLALMLLTLLLAPLVARLFGEPRLTAIVALSSLAVPLTAATAQFSALLQRRMEWGSLQAIGIVSQMLAAAVAIVMAIGWNAGYWSLVTQGLVHAAAALLLSILVCPWRPTRVTDWRASRESLHVGMDVVGFNIVNYWHRQLDKILIGWKWGAADIGFYSRAHGLATFAHSILSGAATQAMIPALSRLQHSPHAYAQAYTSAVQLLCWAVAPISLGLFVFARPTIQVLFGPAWEECVPVFRILSLSLVFQALNVSGVWIFLSRGDTRRMLRWTAMVVAALALAFVMAIPYGPVGIAIAYSGVIAIAAPCCICVAGAGTLVRISEIAKVAIAPVSASVAAGLIASRILVASADLYPWTLLSAVLAYLIVLMLSFLIALTFEPSLMQSVRRMTSSITAGWRAP